LGEAALVPLANQLESSCVECAPSLGLIWEFGGTGQDPDHPFLKGNLARLSLLLERPDLVIMQINH